MPLVKPLVKHLQGDLWEVRTQLANRIARVIFAVEGNTQNRDRRFGAGAKALEAHQAMKASRCHERKLNHETCKGY